HHGYGGSGGSAVHLRPSKRRPIRLERRMGGSSWPCRWQPPRSSTKRRSALHHQTKTNLPLRGRPVLRPAREKVTPKQSLVQAWLRGGGGAGRQTNLRGSKTLLPATLRTQAPCKNPRKPPRMALRETSRKEIFTLRARRKIGRCTECPGYFAAGS